MAVKESKRLSDGSLSLEGGNDSGRAPNLLAKNQYAFGINTTCRGGWLMPRPGIKQIRVDFRSFTDAEDDFKNGRFQFAGGYTSDDGLGFLISMHNGRQVKINVGVNTTRFDAADISIEGDLNPPNREQAWGCQGENYFIIQDGQTLPYIFNGVSGRRALPNEVPVGKQIVYYMGRLWVANGKSYVAGDIVRGPSGTAENGLRDSMLKFTENKYLAEGGAFSVPLNSGEITCLIPMVNLNTALGQGDLIVGTDNSAFATAVPQDRLTWKDTTQPLQRVIQDVSGMVNQDSTITVNGDLFYRSEDGWRSLIYAVRFYQDNEWGNTPISLEMDRILQNDAPEFLQFGSAVVFDNRMLGTASPGYSQGHGVFYRCLVSLDFNLVTSMKSKEPPAWEGIWTGLRILKIIKVRHKKVTRCFIYALNENDECGLWEVTKKDKFDNGSQRIEWWVESRAMNFGTMFDRKKLASGDVFIDRVTGLADIQYQFRPDGHPCWIDWDSWRECSKYQTCEDEFGNCPTLKEYKEQYRPKHQLKQPPDTTDPNTNEFYRVFFELQTRTKCTGFFRLKQQRFNAEGTDEVPYGEQAAKVDDSDECPALLTCCPDEGWLEYRIQETTPDNNIVAELDGALWRMPCAPHSGTLCDCSDPADAVVTVNADDEALFNVSVRIRGVVELFPFIGSTVVAGTGGHCSSGDATPSTDWNTYDLIVSDPPMTYHLNRDPVNTVAPFSFVALDYDFVFQAWTGATVTLRPRSHDGLQLNNDVGLTVDAAGLSSEITQPFDGQFMQMDVKSVTLA